jgi:hypothetical protein
MVVDGTSCGHCIGYQFGPGAHKGLFAATAERPSMGSSMGPLGTFSTVLVRLKHGITCVKDVVFGHVLPPCVSH